MEAYRMGGVDQQDLWFYVTYGTTAPPSGYKFSVAGKAIMEEV